MSAQSTATDQQDMIDTSNRQDAAKAKLDGWKRLMGRKADYSRNAESLARQNKTTVPAIIAQMQADRDEAVAAFATFSEVWNRPSVVEAAGVLAYRPKANHCPVTGDVDIRFDSWFSRFQSAIAAE